MVCGAGGSNRMMITRFQRLQRLLCADTLSQICLFRYLVSTRKTRQDRTVSP